MGVCVCVYFRPPDRPIFPNNEVVNFQPRTVTDPDLGSVSNAYTTSTPPTHPPVPTVFWIVFFPSPRTYLLSTPHISPVNADSLSIFTHFYPPHLARLRSDCPPGSPPSLRPPPLFCASLLCRAIQRSSSL